MILEETISDRISRLNVCVIIPTYNNSKTLERVINGVLELTSNVLVINDGSTDATFEILKKYYPKLKIVARGNSLKAYGEPEILDEFEKRLTMLINYFNKYNKLDENSIEHILTSNGKEQKASKLVLNFIFQKKEVGKNYFLSIFKLMSSK